MGFVFDALSSLSDSDGSSVFSNSSSNGENGWSIKDENIAGIAIYSVVFFFTIGMYAYKRYKTALPCQSMSTIFYIGLPSFMLRLPQRAATPQQPQAKTASKQAQCE